MALLSAETVRRRLRDLPDERFAAFVGALWAARGADVEIAGGAADARRTDGVRLVRVRRGERTETLVPVTGRTVPAATSETETLVLARPASAVRGTDRHGGRVIDADDLHAMLLYAVPRSTADDLCQRFLDRPLVTDTPPSRPMTERVPEYSAPLVVGLLGVTLVVVGVFGGSLLYGDADVAVFGAPESVGADPPDRVGTTAAPPTETPRETATGPSDPDAYPPGLGPDGVVDEDVLADTHAKRVTGQSYRWTITHREFVDGRPNAYRRETVFVASPTSYRTALDGAGQPRRADLTVADVEAYADGETRYQRRAVSEEADRAWTVDESPVRGVRNGEERYADRAERYIEWFLSVSESEVVDSFERGGTRYYWVRLGEDPYPGVANSSGSALVDETGVVHELRRRYDVPGDGGLSAVVTFRYTDFGTTTVRPPPWYEASGAAAPTNRSGGTTTTAETPPPTATNATTNTTATNVTTNTTATNVTTNATATSSRTDT